MGEDAAGALALAFLVVAQVVELEPETLAGVPRTMYLPHPLQIFQTKDEVVILSEYVHTWRWIPLFALDRYPGYESWMGDPRGRWEGDTLVVEVVNQNDQTWFDRSGNWHSDAMKVTERFTPTGPLALLPLTDGRSGLVWTMKPETAREMAELPDAAFLTRLQDAFGFRLGRFTRVGSRQLGAEQQRRPL